MFFLFWSLSRTTAWYWPWAFQPHVWERVSSSGSFWCQMVIVIFLNRIQCTLFILCSSINDSSAMFFVELEKDCMCTLVRCTFLLICVNWLIDYIETSFWLYFISTTKTKTMDVLPECCCHILVKILSKDP